MLNVNDSNDKRERAISACLDKFCNKGLYETTSRDLSRALKLQSGGMYQYFQSKDEAVLVCAEEAACLLEKYLVKQAIIDIGNIDVMFDTLIDRAEKLSHMMRFLAQVCSIPKYREEMNPVLDRLTQRYEKYTQQLAEYFGCSQTDIRPYFYICVTAISHYMIFGKKKSAISQILLVKQALKNNFCGGMANNESK